MYVEALTVLQSLLQGATLVLLVVGSVVSIWYFVVYLASIFVFRREKPKTGPGKMRFAVVIPTYNDDVSPSVKSSVMALGKKEVFVVDTSDREEVKKRNRRVCEEYGANYLWLPRGGYKAWNLNRALERMNLDAYDYVLFLDADASIPRDFFLRAEGYLENHPVEALQTEWIPYPGVHRGLTAYFSWVYAAVFQRLVAPVLNFFESSLIFGSGFLVRSNVLKKLRFDENYIAEDFKLALDILEAGGRVRYTSSTGIYVSQPVSLTEMAKQLERWGYGSAQVLLSYLRKAKLPVPVLVISITALSAHVITPAYVTLAMLSSLLLPSPGIPLALATAAYLAGVLPLAVISLYHMGRDGVNYPLSKKVLSYLLNMPFWFVFTWEGVSKALRGKPLRWEPTEKVISSG